MHIEKMAANSPGTEIRVAVSKVLDSRMISLPTIVYVLTDGLVSNSPDYMLSTL